MNHVCLIGVGALGIRHLEGLLKANTPMLFTIVDPSPTALERARALPPSNHTVSYSPELPDGNVDVAIIATTSGHRAAAVRDILARASVRFIILEKILFARAEDYGSIGALLKEKNVEAWVNTSLRIMPVRRDMRDAILGHRFSIHFAGGSRHGLMTNLVHYADYASYLAGSSDFELDTQLLSSQVLDSKRSGYKELQGSVELRFNNGSRVLCTSLAHLRPRRTIISSRTIRAVFDESDDMAHVANERNQWTWKSGPAPLMRQSDMTGLLVEEILSTGSCELPTYEESARIHLNVLEPIRSFLASHRYTFDVAYPFT